MSACENLSVPDLRQPEKLLCRVPAMASHRRREPPPAFLKRTSDFVGFRPLFILSLHGCREVTEIGIASVARNCNALKKLSCASCMFGAMGVYAFVNNCTVLEELSVKRLQGFDDDSAKELVPQMVSSSLKSICLKELIIGQRKLNSGLVEIHLEKVQVGDVGLLGISKCSRLETLHLVKTSDCSDVGLCDVVEGCKMLKKLHIDGWRTNRISDSGLISVAKSCHVVKDTTTKSYFHIEAWRA
ncbi:hypothetical protein RJT34_09459 [Clitoria ternatea]|uniref:F-box protein n=1 Tax=Clitoria ternatea TaxID=43366 RepID=A0AAN9K883_CLITE